MRLYYEMIPWKRLIQICCNLFIVKISCFSRHYLYSDFYLFFSWYVAPYLVKFGFKSRLIFILIYLEIILSVRIIGLVIKRYDLYLQLNYHHLNSYFLFKNLVIQCFELFMVIYILFLWHNLYFIFAKVLLDC